MPCPEGYRDPTLVKLDQVAGEEAGQTSQAQANSEGLCEDPVKMVFNFHLYRNFNHILEAMRSMEWAMFLAAIVDAAA